MLHRKVKLSAIFLLFLGVMELQAQVAVPATGGNASGAGGTANYSVGQVVYTTITEVTGSVTQGVQQPQKAFGKHSNVLSASVTQEVQQPFEILVVTGIEPDKNIILQCSAYPNPATDYVALQIGNIEPSGFMYKFFDMNGKLIISERVKINDTYISMDNLVSATYILKVIQNNQEVKTFKIIKN